MSYYDDAPLSSTILSGSGGGRKESHSIQTHHSTVSSSSSSSSSLLKQQTVLRRKYAECVQEWIHIDDQLQQVMDSIAHLRDRILVSSRWIQKQQQSQQQQQPEKHGARSSGDDGTKKIDSSWKTFGFRHQPPPQQPQNCGSFEGIGVFLEVHDLELALSHELLQHEQMLSLARTLLFSLSTTLDTMSRRFDEWIVWELDVATAAAASALVSTSTSTSTRMTRHEKLSAFASSNPIPSLSVTDAQNAYVFLGQDLYRKQGLVQQVLDTARQENLIRLVQRDEKNENNSENINDMIGWSSSMLEEEGDGRPSHGGLRRRIGILTKVARSSAQEWKLLRQTRKEEWQVINRFSALVLPSSSPSSGG
jgi:hypothetical protein